MKKFFILLVIVLVSASVFGAGKAEEKTTGVEGKEGPFKISIVNRVPRATFNPETNIKLKKIEEEFNVEFDYEAPPGSNYDDRVNIIMASGDLPDLIHLSTDDPSYPKFARDGLIIPLDDYVKGQENLNRMLNDAQWRQGMLNGMIYSIPRPQRRQARGGVIRTDWLENVGMEVPETKEEFLDVLRAFTFNDPDGNGKDDTYGVTLTGGYTNLINIFPMVITSAFNLNGWNMHPVNGKVTLMPGQDNFMEMLDYVKQIHDEGLVNPEWYMHKNGDSKEVLFRGEAGIHLLWDNVSAWISRRRDLRNNNPDAELGFMLPLKNNQGTRTFFFKPATWGTWAVTSEAEDPQKVVDFLNDMFSEKAIKILYAGIQGKTYESYDWETKVMKRTPEQAEYNNGELGGTYLLFCRGDVDGGVLEVPGDTEELRQQFRNYRKSFFDNVDILKGLPYQNLPEYVEVQQENPILENKLIEKTVGYIVDDVKRSDIVSFINDEYLPKNEKLIKAMQDYYNKNMK
jgi:ABC-type glycerol-3-phosphate transport system substrate-binding protein